MQDTISHNKLSRRSFAKVLASGALAVGFDPVARSWVTLAQAASGPCFEELPPLDGALYLDETTRTEYAQDYGQIIHKRPLAVLKPGSLQDVGEMVRFARRHKLRIAARGQGHLPFGQAQVENGVVIDLRSLHTVHTILSDRMEVDAGISWRELVRTALTRGLAPPVLTSFLGLTVGGTLSIGGIGSATFREGAQVDNVSELQVVTGEGAIVTCSDQHNPDLFEAVLAGQGQCAVITRATVRLVPAPATVREFVLRYGDLPTLMRDGMRLADDGRFEGVIAVLLPTPSGWRYFLVCTSHFTPPHAPDNAVLLSGLDHLPGSELVNDYSYLQYVDSTPNLVFEKSRPDLTLCIPGSTAPAFTADLLQRLTPEDLGTASVLQLFFWPRGRFTRPLFRVPDEENCVGLAMLRTQTSDPNVVARMLAGNRTLFEQNRSPGGTHYPFSAVGLSRHDWRRHYGSHWDMLVRAKQCHDPDNVFASGPDLFDKHLPKIG